MWSNLRKLLLGLVADSGLPFAVVVALISLQVAAAPPTSAAPVPTAPPSATVPGACQPVGDLHFICGVTGVEDFLPVGGGRWLVGDSLQPLHTSAPSAGGTAGLYLIDTTSKTARRVELSVAAKPDARYANCTPPDLTALNTHGLDVTISPGDVTTVYVINHRGRESVEVFRLHAQRNSAEWAGCVVLPSDAIGNSVDVLPDGSFVVSKFLDANDKSSAEHARAGEVTGAVYLWTVEKGFSEVPGTRFSGNNGLLVSPDRKWLYVNAWGSHQIYRVPFRGKGQSSFVKVDFRPDNMRWAPDGKILVTGQFVTPGNENGLHGWTTVRFDPLTMSVTPVVKEPGYGEFDNASNAVQIGNTLYFGTFSGDRVAYRPAP